jgi:hypothetical protein
MAGRFRGLDPAQCALCATGRPRRNASVDLRALMSQASVALATQKSGIGPVFQWWRVAMPALVVLGLATAAARGTGAQSWLYFAVFAGVIAALVTEPLPNPAISMVGPVLSHAVRSGRPGQARVQCHLPDHQPGTLQLCQHDRLAGRRRVHVPSRPPEDRAGAAHRSAWRRC